MSQTNIFQHNAICIATKREKKNYKLQKKQQLQQINVIKCVHANKMNTKKCMGILHIFCMATTKSNTYNNEKIYLYQYLQKYIKILYMHNHLHNVAAITTWKILTNK